MTDEVKLRNARIECVVMQTLIDIKRDDLFERVVFGTRSDGAIFEVVFGVEHFWFWGDLSMFENNLRNYISTIPR